MNYSDRLHILRENNDYAVKFMIAEYMWDLLVGNIKLTPKEQYEAYEDMCEIIYTMYARDDQSKFYTIDNYCEFVYSQAKLRDFDIEKLEEYLDEIGTKQTLYDFHEEVAYKAEVEGV